MTHTPLMQMLKDSTIRSAIDIVQRLNMDMTASPVDDVTIISRPQLEVIEAALRLLPAMSSKATHKP